MSSEFKYTAGLNNVGSYQVSGIPFASGSLNAATAISVSFPYVTQWVTVVNHSASHLRIGFSQNGVEGTNYVRVGPENGSEGTQSLTLKVKVTELWFSGSAEFDIAAGLTTIPTARITNISPSGSSWSGSSGVG